MVILHGHSQWSCRESNPMLYQGLCPLISGFVPFRSFSVPLVTCGFVSGLDGVKSGHLPHHADEPLHERLWPPVPRAPDGDLWPGLALPTSRGPNQLTTTPR
jgi:hypothetical protein